MPSIVHQCSLSPSPAPNLYRVHESRVQFKFTPQAEALEAVPWR